MMSVDPDMPLAVARESGEAPGRPARSDTIPQVPTLSCRDLVFSYGNGPCVLAIEHLEVGPGSLCAIQGPNGAGKSTLLWILAGLLPPTKGWVTLAGRPMQIAGRHGQRDVTLVMEDPYLLRTTVRDNVDYGLARRGVPRSQRQRRIFEALEMVGLDDRSQVRSWELSQGERKRVALARALALGTSLLLLDEPTSNVDHRSAALIERAIADLKGRTTVVLSTHDIGQSGRLADEVVTLVDGRISDISHENLMELEAVQRDGQRLAVLFEGWEIPLDPGPDGDARLLVDPWAISLTPAKGSGDSVRTLIVSALTREKNSVRILMNGRLNLVARMTLDDYRAAPVGLGEEVLVDIPPMAIRVLKGRAMAAV